ncbi:MAG: DUF1330 domain-containing protein [Deinococcota bacterium]
MPAYLIYRASIYDMDAYRENYMSQTPAILEAYGGKFIARGGTVETLEGDVESRRVVLIEFPSMEAAKAFYNSDEYTRARAARAGIADAQMILLDGVPVE